MTDEHLSKLIPLGLLLVLGALEAMGGLYLNDRRSKNDFTLELVSLATLPTLIQPAIFLVVFLGLDTWGSGWNNSLVNLGIGWQILAFLIFDDLTQYAWHRLSHISPLLWKLHRPHHVAEEMGVLVTYRNAVLYYALMPGIWLTALLVYVGMGPVYLFYLPIKLAVILLAHSETKWDRFLYNRRWLRPVAWIVERTVSTPCTHYAHHGLTAEDGISNPNGNFGNLLFFWDVLFGTAKITRRYPTTFGVWNSIKEPWYVQLLFPMFRSKNPRSELNALRTPNDLNKQ